ncbi:unnamed protein product [Rotaria sp. Silwood2]|nr:unnamed protein product [Rotaria sp. Silwood2]CAF2818210.1 unnamed protein product [Rotaria sp. Silwood2]CAF3069772.1 unnamed protein product [Rotaria sp. Silwood2]CAF4066084.1 unnamed protein product [Rotaria sp. Silwood2]CAF4261211.1 unnamed protein product [Rotaria sp. Silwood2]
MSMTTTITTTVTSNTSTHVIHSPEQLAAIFKDPIVVIRFYQFGYLFTFLLGFPGNIASLFTFSQPTLRKISTGCLFLLLAISDTVYLLMYVLDCLEFGVQIHFYGHGTYDQLCQFRTFVKYISQVTSAWILAIVSVDRWIRTRFPFKAGSMCTPKKALIAVAVVLVVNMALYSHILFPMFGTLIPGFSRAACGPKLIYTSYSEFYLLQWGIIQIFTGCLVPAITMFTILIDISISIRVRKRMIIQPIHISREDNNMKRQQDLQKQMFILMFASICIFLITSLPLAIYKIISVRQENLSLAVFHMVIILTALTWFQSLFYAVNFYFHCLGSTLFRNEFKKQCQRIWNTRQSQDRVMENTTANQRIQTHIVPTKY